MGSAERSVMQGMVDEYYARFKNIVQTNRHLSDSRLTEVSDGRVFTGHKSVELGLADQAGMLTDAIELAKEMAHIPGGDVVIYKRPYGYGGSIYARDSGPAPEAKVMELQLAPQGAFLPTGFYYLWRPGR